jgi:hypothetical protein
MKTTKYKPEDQCWLLENNLLYNVIIVEARTFLPGEFAQFTMYRVREEHSEYLLLDRWHHAANLFLRPAEVALLRARVEDDKRALDYVLEEVEVVA